MTVSYVRLGGFVLFLAVLVVADWALATWGSATIRRRPRPMGRLTILFAGLCAGCAALELAAARAWQIAPAVGVIIFALQFPAAIVVVLGIDRLLPGSRT